MKIFKKVVDRIVKLLINMLISLRCVSYKPSVVGFI